jgi:hypothetical protein
MSDESAPFIAPIPPPSPEAVMPSSSHKPARKRNTHRPNRPKRPKLRNAAPPPPRPRAPAAKRDNPEPPPNKKESLVHLIETLGGAAATSVIGALAVRWGLHPELVSAGLGGIGTWTAWQSDKSLNRFVALGAASAAGSQLLLMKMNPAAAPPAPVKTPAPPAQAQLPASTAGTAAARPRSADLGTLPPGMLDAAFERARAELAVAGGGYPAGYDHGHHGPFAP